jgi:predicted dehydrogenase
MWRIKEELNCFKLFYLILRMNILLIGLGSIGKRHLRNILSLGYNDVSVVSNSFSANAEFEKVTVFKTIDEAFASNHFDAAFVCSPTAFHIEQLIALLKNRVKSIYIEKPLNNSLQNVDVVLQLANKYFPHIVVGYDLHFDPGIQRIREWIKENRIDRIVSANAFVGQHLPQWRPYEDHRQGMSAKKETGGGVMLDLIHEVDYLYWLLGNVETVACNYINTGELEIETEEAADMLLKFSNGVTATVHLDYWQPKLKRFCILTGTKGTIHWNLSEQNVTITNLQGEQEEFSYQSFNRNDRFVCIVKTFLENANDERLTKLPDAIESLKVILAAKHAGENSCVVRMVNS